MSVSSKRFIFINAGERRAFNLAGGEFPDFDLTIFADDLELIREAYKQSSGCACAMAYFQERDGGKRSLKLSFTRSDRAKKTHAEEEQFIKLQLRDIKVHCMLIDLEPCTVTAEGKPRYKGHNCLELFRPTGRQLKLNEGSTKKARCSFVPTQPFTPIFYLERQTHLGTSSSIIPALSNQTASQAADVIRNTLGVPKGMPQLDHIANQYFIQGEEKMSSARRESIFEMWKIPEEKRKPMPEGDPKVDRKVR